MSAAAQYVWPPYTQFDSYNGPSTSTNVAPRRGFQDLLGYDSRNSVPGTFQDLLQPTEQPTLAEQQTTFHSNPQVTVKGNTKGKRRAETNDNEEPKPARRGGPRISKEVDMYPDLQSVLDVLRMTLGPATQDVDFGANFVIENDPPVSDKDRVKALTHEIWRATGFRWTIKDHPKLKEGHKTRYWCSQDECGRAKIKGPPSADNKLRYPCRSSLLICCKSDTPEFSNLRLMSVRLHHHCIHGIDPESPDSTSTIAWKSPPEQTFHPVHDETPKRPPRKRQRTKAPRAPAVPSPEPAVKEMSPPPGGYLTVVESSGLLTRVRSPPSFLAPSSSSSFQAHRSDSPPAEPYFPPGLSHPNSPQEEGRDVNLPPEIYRTRMHQHIRNIRDFCDGLEYQLQFGDQRILGALETQGEAFLDLVHDCLRREGRLIGGENEGRVPDS